MMDSEIMMFKPSMSEFQNFDKYIEFMESKGAHLAGISKVIPPPEWIPRKSGYDTEDIMNLKIPSPIRQTVEGKLGLYNVKIQAKRSMTVKEYKAMAESKEYRLPDHFTYREIEKKFWSTVTYKPSIYGADVPGSITDESLKIWNINRLGTILDYIKQDYGTTISGVNTAYLYFGMWKSSFAWHTEDMELYSINYIHDGYPKTWYAIPPRQGFRFQTLAQGLFPEGNNCQAFLRHKTVLIAPHVLNNQNIPFRKIVQEKGEIMITFPFGYHAGFNHGYNIAESTNFASPRWVEYGKRSLKCRCDVKDKVRIDMDIYVKRLQPERYEDWLNGKDYGYHPENLRRFCAAPKPEQRYSKLK